MSKFKLRMKREITETRVLFRSISALPFAVFVASIVVMNILANKLIVDEPGIALDAGIVVSWVAFLAMDTLVKRFGPKAATKVTLAAIIINLLVVAMLNIAAAIPGAWGEGSDAALNATIAGSWQVILASTTAFIVSAAVNNAMHWLIKKRFKKSPDGFFAYAAGSYGSTLISQFVDNFVFAMLFTFAKGWITFPAALTFAAVGALVELACQIVFSPVGYLVAERWKKQNVGKEYLDLIGHTGVNTNESTDNGHE